MGTRASGGGGASFPDVVPFDVQCLTRLSWELGSRTVADDESTLRGEWEHTGTSWTLSHYRVTANTDIVRLRTPVGRERFYGVAQMDLEAVLPNLENAPYWRRRE
ncbi:hypothetical protein GL213_03695 [Halogeometricum borinquense]|uniref:Uncharacterized protein n=1 Tax=Halogeometricum borinquense TaxID=60847 RepID=A0A6C0UIX5_9EURY|nr:hypothetical protein [Halogeometricum borinquense]QIB75442.1 hypothetical protein G3I44_14735 [Halogeometricum borinquense]QIQ75710.1 hypothetical protein GL213_03695 [Halogeometricum borinquense]